MSLTTQILEKESIDMEEEYGAVLFNMDLLLERLCSQKPLRQKDKALLIKALNLIHHTRNL